jgi:hypothetical protein
METITMLLIVAIVFLMLGHPGWAFLFFILWLMTD